MGRRWSPWERQARMEGMLEWRKKQDTQDMLTPCRTGVCIWWVKKYPFLINLRSMKFEAVLIWMCWGRHPSKQMGKRYHPIWRNTKETESGMACSSSFFLPGMNELGFKCLIMSFYPFHGIGVHAHFHLRVILLSTDAPITLIVFYCSVETCQTKWSFTPLNLSGAMFFENSFRLVVRNRRFFLWVAYNWLASYVSWKQLLTDGDENTSTSPWTID